LWHTLILQNWKEFFGWLPVETMIHENQNDYYAAINASNTTGESTIFVSFMLNMILEMLRELWMRIIETTSGKGNSTT
jgi:Fic family protein